MGEELKNEKNVHEMCHSLNKGMPEPSGLVGKFEETIERFASVEAQELLNELNHITEDKQ